MYYLWYFLAVLPQLLFMSMCALPAVAGIVIGRKEFRLGNRSGGLVFVAASLASSLATLLMVGPFLWGSSTDALVWAVAPFWSTIVLGVAIAVGRIGIAAQRIVIRAGKRPSRVGGSSAWVNALLVSAVVVASVLVVSMVHYVFRNGARSVAEHASNPEVLRQLYHRQGGGSSSSGVQLFLAQNDATPGDVLDSLSRSGLARVRMSVARNNNTPLTARTRLVADSNPMVRSFARGELPPPRP